MVFEFLCPQGHKIRASEDRAGRPAKCPKCGEKFLIPQLSEMVGPDAGGSSTDLDAAKVTASQGSAAGRSSEQMEFLCPNGHRLWAPTQLQGKAGQCPECGTKLRIPRLSVRNPNLDEATSSGLSLGTPEENERPESRDSGIARLTTNQNGTPDVSFPRLFARLWNERAEDVTMEIQTPSSKGFLPDRFLAELSGQSHAVFATKETDGTETITAIPWNSLEVVVRGRKPFA